MILKSALKNKYYPLWIMAVGMILTHLFFTLLVYLSNLHLHQNMSQLLAGGFLAVPNIHILPSLLEIDTAFKGAVFFTFSIGVVLPFLVLTAARVWDRIFQRNRMFLIFLSGFVIFCMMLLNRNGFNPIVTFWFLTIYIIVFKLTLWLLPDTESRFSSRQLLTHVTVLLLLVVPWKTTASNSNFFIAVRDHILLPTSFGSSISDYYYRYSPYPTEAIKPILKKQIKTYRFDGDFEEATLQRLQTTLIRYDCLPVDSGAGTDFSIRAVEGKLSFSVKGRAVLKTVPVNFLADPGVQLNRLSSRSDRNLFTRELLAFSCVYVLPVILYACLFSLFQLIFGRVPGRRSGFRLSSAGCIVVGIGILLIFKSIVPGSIPTAQVKQALSSDDPDIRVAAFQTISSEGLNPSKYLSEVYSNSRSYLPERIWWAICLANDPDVGANKVLLQLLDDPNPLVACKAFQSLGRKKYRPAIDTILEKIKSSRHWYVQGYAYNALRSLGWRQTLSD